MEYRCASDLHWEHFGDFALNPKCWPDPAAMVKELDSMGIRAMISVWPFVQGGSVYGHDYNASGPSVNFEPMHAKGLLVRDGATGKQAPLPRWPFFEGTTNGSTDYSPYYPAPDHKVTHEMFIMDPYNPAARAYVFEQLKKNYMK